MGFSLGKLLGGVATGFLAGGPAGAIAGGALSLTSGPKRPQITPPLTGQTPYAGGASGGFGADSVIYQRGILGNTNLKVYNPYGYANIMPQPRDPDVPQNWPGGGGVAPGGNVQYNVASCPVPTRNGYRIMPSPCSGYHWNRERYYVFGDCRKGTGPGLVEAGTKLVRNRHINPANAQAARRAARRLHGTVNLLRSIERATAKLVRGRKSRAGSGRGRAAASCKCK